ncbi:putative ubiquitin-like-specific protease 2B [Platanthera zijinensis]|uniref:Ubiquitin-like-specific protease 2B n=1 Tax=Platanthera zijinensis TaxID=2320716 RepID=A0AAP0B2M9_9ASPA
MKLIVLRGLHQIGMWFPLRRYQSWMMLRIGSLLQENALVMEASRILVGSPYDDEDSVIRSSELPVNLMSNEEESCTSTSEVSSTTGDWTETDGHPDCQVFEHYGSTCEEMDDNKSTVVVCPDYVTYRDSLFLESQLTFSSECIKIVCFDANIPNEKLVLVCDIADIMCIGCRRSKSVGALLFKFWIRNDAGRDPEKFVASVTDMFWSEKELKIKSLAARYEDIWDTLPDSNCALVDDMFRTRMSFSKRYFTEYLQVKVQPMEKLRFHFFNCFFFRKLADLDKDPESISEGRAAYQRVRKWTRKLNIFEKDYLFIPVNFSLHWSLLVICHPGEIITFEDDDLMNSPKVPCILHMDSLKGNHKGLGDLIRSYLLEEWKGRHSECSDDVTSRFSNLRFVHLELPQQENSSDCGLFLLHYVELFLEEAPLAFNPTKITKSSNFQLSADWFPPSEASFKRFHIRGLIYELLRDSSQKSIPTSSNEDFPCFANDADQAVEFLSAQESPSKGVSGSTLILPSTAQDVSFEQTSHFNSSEETCHLEEYGHANADATEHLDGESGADDSAERVIPIDNPSFQIFSTFYEAPSISDQVMEAVANASPIKSNVEPAISNETDETQKIASPIVFGCQFVPDTPDTSNLKLEKFAENSQEAATGNILEEVKKYVDPQLPSPAAEDQCCSTKTCPGTYPADTQTVCEEEHEQAKPRNNGGVEEIDGDYLAEDLDAGDLEMRACEEIGEVADSQENDVGEHRISHHGSAATTEVILLDNDVTPPKRSKISGSVQRASKRRKLEQPDVGPRVTRSSARKTSS